MKLIKNLSAFTLLLLLTACGNEQTESTNDVKFYLDNPDLMNKKLEDCKQSVEKQLTINCANAKKAAAVVEMKLLQGDGIPRNK
jgi:hypothetical protein